MNDQTFTEYDYNSIMGEMAPYCPDVSNQPKQDSSGAFDKDASKEAANKCYERYLQVQLPVIQKMRGCDRHERGLLSPLGNESEIYCSKCPGFWG